MKNIFCAICNAKTLFDFFSLDIYNKFIIVATIIMDIFLTGGRQ